MVLLLVALVTASSPTQTPVVRTGLRAQLDVGGMLGAPWFVPTGRERLTRTLELGRTSLFQRWSLDADSIAESTPVAGAWIMASHTSDTFERAMLIASGSLQVLGLTLQGAQLLAPTEDNVHEAGPVLKISPIAAGRLGLSLRVSGF